MRLFLFDSFKPFSIIGYLGYAYFSSLLPSLWDCLRFHFTLTDSFRNVERTVARAEFLHIQLQREGTKIHNISEMLDKAKETEQMSVRDYNRFARERMENADSATKRIFEDLVIDEERHLDPFETQEEHIEKYGEQFLSLQSFERGKPISGPGGDEA